MALQLLDLAIERDRPRFHVKIADFGLARMVGPTNNIAVSKVSFGCGAKAVQLLVGLQLLAPSYLGGCVATGCSPVGCC